VATISGHRLLVANRGEVAVRVLRAAAELGLPACAVVAEDESDAPHARLAEAVEQLPGHGPAGYLDVEALVAAAQRAGCTLLHPGWGFVSEDPALAHACHEASITFVGPAADALNLLGDKVAARALAQRHDVPVLAATGAVTDPADVRGFLERVGGEAFVKAVAGGGGRGLRRIGAGDDLPAVLDAARSEARAAFGREEVYLEQALTGARHVEVQVAADTAGGVVAIGDRDCSLQRRHQKLVEIAPAPGLPDTLRQRLADDAVRVVRGAGLTGLATVEFLVQPPASADGGDEGGWDHRFLEVNPRLQVEHTVTEEVLRVDLVASQLLLAVGASLAELGLDPPPAAHGTAVQARIGAETPHPDGGLTASAGTVTDLALPGGPGVRVDTHLVPGTRVSTRYDSLLAKVIAHAPTGGLPAALARLARALGELRIAGVDTNAALLQAIVEDGEVASGRLATHLVDDRLGELLEASVALGPAVRLEAGPDDGAAADAGGTGADDGAGQVPLAADEHPVRPATAGVVVAVQASVGDVVQPTTPLLLLEAMKMQHEVAAGVAGHLTRLEVEVGDEVTTASVVAVVAIDEHADAVEEVVDDIDLDAHREDLAEVERRRHLLTDEARGEAVAKRHGRGLRTARENLDDLIDPGELPSSTAASPSPHSGRRRSSRSSSSAPRPTADRRAGAGQRQLFEDDRAQTVVISYDYMVWPAPRARWAQEEGPTLRAHRTAAPARRVLHRGRRRPARRHRRRPGRRARHGGVRAVGRAVGAGAAHRRSPRDAASRATRSCSAPATSPSPPPRPPSAWAVPP
jgi:acetyl/propionyl-CoA carboxylase alpha subunit